MGSPMGAYFIMVTSVPGVRPMSRMCWRSATSSNATETMIASLPISNASSLTCNSSKPTA